MRIKYLLSSFLIVIFLAGNAQDRREQMLPDSKKDVVVAPPPAETKPDTGDVYTIVEEMPGFPGGMHKMYEFVAQNIVYPQKEKEEGIQGKVFVKFVVEKDGSIDKIQVLRGVPGGKALDDEAVRVIKIMPKWMPGKQGGKVVSVYYNLPVSFKLDGK